MINCIEITGQRKKGLELLEGLSCDKVRRKCIETVARSDMQMRVFLLLLIREEMDKQTKWKFMSP